jgi:hypothetical protein
VTDIPEDVTLDYQRARDLLTEIVTERGRDYTYTAPRDPADGRDAGSCDYWHGDEPGCLIGNALFQLGVTDQFLMAQEGNNAEALLDTLTYKFNWQVAPGVNWLFVKAQEMQDKREEWGFALDEGIEYADRRMKEET